MIAWIDLETTGLDTECSIIEIACVVTNEVFTEVASYESLVHPDTFGIFESYAQQMHVKSGLWQKSLDCNKHIEQIDREFGSFLSGIHNMGKTEPLILGGQSVHFDRGFIERWMRLSNGYLSHRQIDVSGLKLMWSYALGIPTEALPPEKSKTTHRAMDDILASIEAAKWYRDFISDGQPVNVDYGDYYVS